MTREIENLTGVPALPNSDKARALWVDERAEEVYVRVLGPRLKVGSNQVHLCKRSAQNAEVHHNFVITPELWQYTKYKKNWMVFVTIDLKTGEGDVWGCLLNHEVRDMAYSCGCSWAIDEDDIPHDLSQVPRTT